MIGKTYGNIDFLQKALDGTWLRNEAISNNISNVNTPGYKRATVEFESMLKNQMDASGVPLMVTNDRHIGNGSSSGDFNPLVQIDRSTSTRTDGNNVNIDVEMGDLAKNSIMYDGLIRQISREFRSIKTIIEEGGK